MAKIFFSSYEAKQLRKEASDLMWKAHEKLEILAKGYAKDHDNDSQFIHRVVKVAKTMEEMESIAHNVNFD